MNNKYLTITEFTKKLKSIFDTSKAFSNMYLKGEISNFKRHTSGHLYFSLKDDGSVINAMMWASQANKLLFSPKDGMKVLVHGRITIYESRGTYQIYVDEMQEDGIGNLYLQYELLKKKLSDEGLFDAKYKKSIPKIPNKIGIITAKTGAAIKDILSTIKRRYPNVETILFPSLVQGDSAAKDIVRNINLASNYDLDVLIIGRGGGSIEDLWAFNEEIVARAIFDCKIPIISAVGHEVDFTIADFVADLRAPTPTGAAEMAVPNINDLINHINNLKIRLNESIQTNLNYKRLMLKRLTDNYILNKPNIMYEKQIEKLDYLTEKLVNILKNKYKEKLYKYELLKGNHILQNPSILYKNYKDSLINLIDKLELVNPLNILKRGYTLTYQSDKPIRSVKNINKDNNITIKFNDGIVLSKVIDIKENIDE